MIRSDLMAWSKTQNHLNRLTQAVISKKLSHVTLKRLKKHQARKKNCAENELETSALDFSLPLGLWQ